MIPHLDIFGQPSSRQPAVNNHVHIRAADED
jgi:hypothetical protein